MMVSDYEDTGNRDEKQNFKHTTVSLQNRNSVLLWIIHWPHFSSIYIYTSDKNSKFSMGSFNFSLN